MNNYIYKYEVYTDNCHNNYFVKEGELNINFPWNLEECSITELQNKVFKTIVIMQSGYLNYWKDEILFVSDNIIYRMHHDQDCCEDVSIDDICGNWEDLINTSIIKAEEVSSEGYHQKSVYDDSYTWTFYHFATSKGYLDLKWYGTSNGYYSERVSIDRIPKDEYPKLYNDLINIIEEI